jgi:hypothetical protein
MTEQQEHESVSRQLDTILENRERRFMFLTRKDRIDDAIAVADEFFEWFSPEHENDPDLIHYFRLDELHEIYEQKVNESKKRNRKRR